MKISVIIPTHNRAAMVESLIDLVQQDLIEGDEIIVVNDGSADGTHELLDRINVVPVHFTVSGGVGRARNAGAQKATGDVLVFFDDDVRPDEGFVVQVRGIFEDSAVDVAQGPHHVGFHGSGGIQEMIESIIWRADMEYMQVKECCSATLHSQAFAIRRGLFEESGGFREDFSGAGGEEFDYAARLLEFKRIHFFGDLTSWHRYERIWPRFKTLVRRSRRWSSIIKVRSVHGRAHYMTAFRLLLGGVGLLSVAGALLCVYSLCMLALCLMLFGLLEWRTAWVGLRAGHPMLGLCAIGLKFCQYMVIAVVVGWSMMF